MFPVDLRSAAMALMCRSNLILASSRSFSALHARTTPTPHSQCGLGCTSTIGSLGNLPSDGQHRRNHNLAASYVPARYLEVFRDVVESDTVAYARDSLIWFHEVTGAPWWLTIVAATLGLRCCVTFPLHLYQHYIFAKRENITHEMNEIVKDLKKEANYRMAYENMPEARVRALYNASIRREWKNLVVRENCHPLKGVITALVQIPMWVVFSVALRNLVSVIPFNEQSLEIHRQLTLGGFGWITDLTQTDPYFVLPIAYILMNLLIVEVYTMRLTDRNKMQRLVTNGIRGFLVVLGSVAVYIPSAVTLYWCTSSMIGLVHNLLIISPRVRRFARIPETDSELIEPYRYLSQRLREKFSRVPGVSRIPRKL